MVIQMARLYKDWKICGSKVFRTDEDGEIVVEVNRKGKIEVEKFIE